ncbi:MAG: tetratricopeptide repeat protein [Myxococcales bacterium]|nr:tetratricopeptide repeat protein [Myxococcales bacterium]
MPRLATAQTSLARAQTTALVRQARWLERSGRLDRAAALLLHATESDPTLEAAYLDLSSVLARLGRHAAAIRILRRGLGYLGAAHAGLLTRLGYHLEARGKLVEAWRVLERARAADLSSPAAALLLGEVGLRLGYWSKAASALRAYLVQRSATPRADGGERRARLGLALAALHSGRYAEAKRIASGLIGAPAAEGEPPRDVAPRALLAAANAALGRCDSALPQLRALRRFEKKLPFIAHNEALCLLRKGAPRQALVSMARYATLRGGRLDGRGLLLRARARSATGDTRGALDDYARADKLDPRGDLRFGADAVFERAQLMLQLGHTDDAQSLCQRALPRRRGKRRWALLALWGRATLRLGDAAAVIERLAKVAGAALQANGAEISWVLGRAHQAREEHDVAAKALRAALQHGHRPASLQPLLISLGALAAAAYHAGKLEHAEQLLRSALDRVPRDVTTRRDLAQVLLARGKVKAAITALRALAAEKARPRHAVAHLLARAYYARSDLAAAAPHFARAARLVRRALDGRLSVPTRRRLRADLQRIRLDRALNDVRRGKRREGLRQLRELSTLSGSDAALAVARSARTNMARVLLRRAHARIAAGATREALEDLDRLGKISGGTAGALAQRGRCALAVAWAQLGDARRTTKALGPRARACVPARTAGRVARRWIRFIGAYARLRGRSRRTLLRATQQIEALAQASKRDAPRLAALAARIATAARLRLARRYVDSGRYNVALAQLSSVTPSTAAQRHDILVVKLAASTRSLPRARADLGTLAAEIPRTHLDLAAIALRRKDPRRALAHLRRAKRGGRVRAPRLPLWIARLAQLLGEKLVSP